ncbi:hypothetical protein [Aquabacterium sp.]|uniref:hypothetical protein n=1 Tax=Aquabacterium sp. TaxID=1872578 RepID=UPI003D6CF21B
MNTASPRTDQAKRTNGLSTRAQAGTRRRPAPLTDDQYLATSLALVADLSRRVRGGAHRHG